MRDPNALARLALVAFIVVGGCVFAGETELVDDGEAGVPNTRPDYNVINEAHPTSGVSLAEALATLNPTQLGQVVGAVSSSLGMDLYGMGLADGTGNAFDVTQWNDPYPMPEDPTTNFQNTTFTTADGLGFP